MNVLAVRGTPSVAELASLGVARISVGGAFAFAALAALADAAEELRDKGTFGYLERASAAGGTRRVRPSAFAGAVRGQAAARRLLSGGRSTGSAWSRLRRVHRPPG